MILICGGIGSGKSVVSRILRANGFEVYDSDLEARRLMDSSDEIKRRLCIEITVDAVDSQGNINRPRVAEVVFADASKLVVLNSIVHTAVKADIRLRMARNPHLFVETAIPVSSGLVDFADEVWHVEAPEDLRIRRVMARNNTTAEAVRARIEAQRAEVVPDARVILNDGRHPLLPAVLEAVVKSLKIKI